MNFTAIVELAQATSPKLMARILSEDHGGGGPQTKIGKLYLLLRTAEREEPEIVELIYGPTASPKESKYRMLKSRLQRIMLNSLLIEDTLKWKYSTYDEAYETGMQQLNLARALLVKRAYKAAEAVALGAFKSVRKHEIPVLNEGLTDVLASLYLGVLRNRTRFEKYNHLNEYYSQCAYDSNIVFRKYKTWKNKEYIFVGNLQKLSDLGIEHYKEVEGIVKKYPRVSRVQLIARNMLIYALRMKGDLQGAVSAISESEVVLSKCHSMSEISFQVFLLVKISCIIRLHDFRLGADCIRDVRPWFKEGTINNVKLAEYKVLLGLQNGNYDYAYEAFQTGYDSAKYLLPSHRTLEVWRVYNAYVQLLILSGKLKENAISERKTMFRISRFVNEVPHYVANKRGLNIQIIIVQAMFFLLRDEQEAFVTRTEALAKYCTRYLKDNDELRHNCFFKLLIEIDKGGFQLELRKRRITTILRRMTSPAAQEIGRRTNTEIIPYEVLWNLIVDHLRCVDPQMRAPDPSENVKGMGKK